MTNEIIETLCIGGTYDGRRVTCEGETRMSRIRLPIFTHNMIVNETYQLALLHEYEPIVWVYVAESLTLGEAVRMLIAKYPKGETTCQTK
jgi:hypothetical protein